MQRGYYTSQWDIRSQTDRRDENGNILSYKVSRRATGEMQCSCGAWKFQRARLHNGRAIPKYDLDYIDYTPNGNCKHIQFVLENRNIEEDDRVMQETQAPIEVITIEGPDGRLKGLVEDLPEWKKK